MGTTAVVHVAKPRNQEKQMVTALVAVGTSELARSAREPLYLKFFVKKCLSDTQTTLPKAKGKPRCMIFQGNKAHQFCQTGV